MTKKRILWAGESTFLNTGYATYGKEVLRRLWETDKFEIAELGSFGPPQDARQCVIPWKHYPVMPLTPEEAREYERSPTHAFGEYKFEQTLLDFKPDVTIDVRDWWMCLCSGTPIWTEGGWKRIEEIAVGDKVWTHAGRYGRVSHLHPVRQHEGELIKISGVGLPDGITMTGEHPIYVRRAGGVWCWAEAASIQATDELYFPLGATIRCDLPRWQVLWLGHFLKRGKLLADDRIRFRFYPSMKSKLQPEIEALQNRAKVMERSNALHYEVIIESAELAQQCGKLSREGVPEEIVCLDQGRMTVFLRHFLRGANGFREGVRQPRLCVASSRLAWQLWQMFSRLGFQITLRSYPLITDNKVSHRFYLNFSTAVEQRRRLAELLDHEKTSEYRDHLAINIHRIERLVGNQPVYNFVVEEDESYCSYFALHNCEFEERSPLRPYFHHVLMPTCDAEPQNPQWLSTYASADAVFAYTDWALEVLRRESGGRINTQHATPPGADFQSFFPLPNKPAHKQSLGLRPDSLIIGMVARNQPRKLYADLMEAFALFLQDAPAPIKDRTYLYIHSCHPDMGWNFPWLINHTGIGHRTLFSYVCKLCGFFQPMLYHDARTHCRRCNRLGMIMPTSAEGLPNTLLNQVYNLFDIYTQYATSEGFGLPLAEAAACGVPVMAVDYSAMVEVIRKTGGYPIKVERFYWENATGCRRALPDNRDCVQKWVNFLLLPEVMRQEKGREARAGVERHFTYERTAKIWEEYLENCSSPARRWDAPLDLHKPDTHLPEGLCDQDWVDQALTRIAGRADLVGSYFAQRMVRDLQWGITHVQPTLMPFNDFSTLGQVLKQEVFTRAHAERILLAMADKRNRWEKQRVAQCKK